VVPGGRQVAKARRSRSGSMRARRTCGGARVRGQRRGRRGCVFGAARRRDARRVLPCGRRRYPRHFCRDEFARRAQGMSRATNRVCQLLMMILYPKSQSVSALLQRLCRARHAANGTSSREVTEIPKDLGPARRHPILLWRPNPRRSVPPFRRDKHAHGDQLPSNNTNSDHAPHACVSMALIGAHTRAQGL
jgi:hypothetical protein